MPTTALVVGLGGTGALAVRHLKKELKGSQSRTVPEGIEVLVFDTIADPQATRKADQLAGLADELDEGDYYYIGGDLTCEAKKVAKGELPHWGTWFQAQTYLQAVPGALNVTVGSSMVRQLGRAALFESVAAPAMSPLYNRLNAKIGAIKQAKRAGDDANLNVFIVTSVAGGTGSGMFVDVAHLITRIARVNHQLNASIWGFFLLPEAFSAIPGGADPAMRARAYAAIRENRRFAATTRIDYVHGYPIHYHERSQTPNPNIWCAESESKLFKFLFYLDGQRNSNPLTDVLPELGATPTIADVIAAMLDGQTRYDQHLTNMITYLAVVQGTNPAAINAQNLTADSTLGSYALVLPMHHIVEHLARRLGLEAAQAFLPAGEVDRDGLPQTLAADRNQEAGLNQRGRQQVDAFLSAGLLTPLAEGTPVGGSNVLTDITTVVGRDMRPEVLAARGVEGWRPIFAPTGDADGARDYRDQFQAELARSLDQNVPNNPRGVQNHTANYFSQHFGAQSGAGTYSGGSYQAVLDNFRNWQQERFRQRLEVQVVNILNGDPAAGPGAGGLSDAARRHKGGKLGYLLDFMAELEGRLGDYLGKLKAMQAAPMRLNQARAIEHEVAEKEAAMVKKPGGPLAGQRRNAYIAAQRKRVAYLRDVLMEQAVVEAVSGMQTEVRRLRQQAEAWSGALATGKATSLYGRLQREQGAIEGLVERDRGVKVREVIWDDDYNDALYQNYANVGTVLDHLSWALEAKTVPGTANTRLRLTLHCGQRQFSLAPQQRTANEEGVYAIAADDQQALYEQYHEVCRGAFDQAWQQESIVKYLTKNQAKPKWSPTALGQSLAVNGSPLLAGSNQGSVVPSVYLHADTSSLGPLETQAQQYLTAVKQQLQHAAGAGENLAQIVPSSERFKLRLVYMLNLVPVEQTASYLAAASPYWSIRPVYTAAGPAALPRETYHLFPAEVNAAHYEARLHLLPDEPKTGLPRELATEVVVELEMLKRLALFINAWSHDIVRLHHRMDGTGFEQFYLLDIPSIAGLGPMPIAEQAIPLTEPSPQPPSIWQALHAFNYVHQDTTGVDIDDQRVDEAIRQARIAAIQQLLADDQLNIEPATLNRMSHLNQGRQDRIKECYAQFRLFEAIQERILRSFRSAGRTGTPARDWDTAGVMWLYFQEQKEGLTGQIQLMLG